MLHSNLSKEKKSHKPLILFSLAFLLPFLAIGEDSNLGGEFRMNKMYANDVYKILTLEQWDNASKTGFIVTELDKKDGFVHLSTSSQLALTLSLFFSEHEKLVLLQLNQEEIKDSLIFEDPIPKGERSGLFPHLYNDLLVTQISGVWHLERGAFILPKEILLQSER